MNWTSSKLRTWLGLSVATFLLLVLIHLALPAIFLILQVPSISLGRGGWILRWQNEATGSGLQFNLLFLLAIAIVLSLILTILRTRKKQTY